MTNSNLKIPSNIATKLKTKLSNVKPLLDPLPTSYLADKLDDHNKNIYATLLSAVVLSKGSITDNESRMLSMLLSRLGLNSDISRYFSQIDDISENQILEFAKVLNNDDKRLSFIFDCLLASRCDKPLTNEQVDVINELCNLWKFLENDIHLMVFWISKILGTDSNLFKNIDDLSDSPLVIYIENKGEPLTNIEFKVNTGEFYPKNTVVAKGEKKNAEIQTIGEIIRNKHENNNNKKTHQIIMSQLGLLADYRIIEKYHIYYKFIPLPDYLSTWQYYLKGLQQTPSVKGYKYE